MVIIYTKDQCPKCSALKGMFIQKGKEFLVRLANDEEVDLLFRKGFRELPVCVDDKGQYYSFQDTIKYLLSH